MQFKVPHTFIIILCLASLVATLTYLLPAGEFSYAYSEVAKKDIIIPGTYHQVPANPQGVLAVLEAPIKGIISAANIIAFVLIVGGTFGIIARTGAISVGIMAFVKRIRGKEILIIPVSMFLFGLGGSTFGMSEETLPFYMIFIPMMIALGYDSLTAIAIIFIGTTAGCMASTLNPFSTGIAQAIVGLTPGSGTGFRGVMWLLILSTAIIFVMRYAARVKANPSSSSVYELDKKNQQYFLELDNSSHAFSLRHKVILIVFALGLSLITWGVLASNWYINEIAMCFLSIGILVALIGKLPNDTASDAFTKGAGDLIGAALVIGFARGVVIIAQEGHILDTLLNSAALSLSDVSSWLFVNMLFVFQFITGLIVPSSSGAAALTMPVMGSLAELAEISQQQNVTAYQLGHGLAILFTPTSGVLMAVLGVARIPWILYARFIFPLIVILGALSVLILTIGEIVPY